MDDIVRQAMAKWPNVPNCHGWLGLDARGDWYLRDAQAQQKGLFTSDAPGAKGSRVQLEKLIAFIGRNYEADAQGRWFFQNGPQRVFVELASAPWVLRITRTAQGFALHTHTGRPVQCQSAHVDEAGHVYLNTDAGLGLVHTQDMHLLADAMETAGWPEPQPVRQADLPSQFGFVPSPEQQAKAAQSQAQQ